MTLKRYENELLGSDIKEILTYVGEEGQMLVVEGQNGKITEYSQDNFAKFLNASTGKDNNNSNRTISKKLESSLMNDFRDILKFENDRYIYTKSESISTEESIKLDKTQKKASTDKELLKAILKFHDSVTKEQLSRTGFLEALFLFGKVATTWNDTRIENTETTPQPNENQKEASTDKELLKTILKFHNSVTEKQLSSTDFSEALFSFGRGVTAWNDTRIKNTETTPQPKQNEQDHYIM